MKNLMTVVCALLVLTGAAFSQPVTVELIVRVHVRTESGAPIGDVPVQLTSGYGFPCAFTNQQGDAEFRFQRQPMAFPLGAGFTDAVIAPIPAEESIRAGQRWRELRIQHAFPPDVFHTVPADAPVFDVQIVAKAAVRASGRVLSPTGDPIKAGAVFANTFSITETGDDGRFECVGLPANQAGKLVLFVEGGQAWLKAVSALQLQGDVNLGDITLAAAHRTAQVRIRAQAASALFDSEMGLVSTGVTIVDQTGATIFSFEVDQEHRTVGFGGVPISPDDRVALPPGVFYVAPGALGNAPSLKLIDLIRANRLAELNAANVPKFTAVEGQTVEFTFDMAAALAAIQSIPDQPTVVNPPPPEASPGP